MIKDEIWVLCDDRPGNYFQALALGSELSQVMQMPYKIINISYNFFSFLPNFILKFFLLNLSKKTRNDLNGFDYYPKVAISAGRRAATILLHIKKQSQNKTKIIQIMNPEINFLQFDFIILPKHDKIKKQESNIIQTIGSLSKVNDKVIEEECKKHEKEFVNITKTKIALLLGGSSKHTKFEVSSALLLAKNISRIAKNMNSVLLVTNSRRTSDEISEIMKKNLDCEFKFFDYKNIKKEENPYLAIIGFSDFLIASGDSVSMISEGCSTGKSVYIFDDKNISSKKHRKFHLDLFNENYARKFDNLEKLENFAPQKLNETKRVAFIINTRINQSN